VRLLLIGVFLTFPGFAGAQVFGCDFPQTAANGGWIAPKVLVFIDEANGTVEAFDGVIKGNVGDDPISGRIDTANARRVTVTWSFQTKDVANQTADMRYRLTIQRADRSASITGQAIGYIGPYTAEGACQVLE
jgi:small ligand-binding sensory domain FIST